MPSLILLRYNTSTRSGATQMHSFTQHLSLGFGFQSRSILHLGFRLTLGLGSKKRKERKGAFNGFGRAALHAGGQFAIIDGTRLLKMMAGFENSV